MYLNCKMENRETLTIKIRLSLTTKWIYNQQVPWSIKTGKVWSVRLNLPPSHPLLLLLMQIIPKQLMTLYTFIKDQDKCFPFPHIHRYPNHFHICGFETGNFRRIFSFAKMKYKGSTENLHGILNVQIPF